MLWFRGAVLKPLTFLAIVTFTALIFTATDSYALENRINGSTEEIHEKADKINRQLDSEIVSKQLKELGLSDNDINERISLLNDEELHHFAGQAEHIYPGSGIGSAIVLTVVILAAAYAYIKYTGKRIVIE